MALWVVWLTVIGVFVLAVGTAYQARTSLSEFDRLWQRYDEADRLEVQKRLHPSRFTGTPGATIWRWWLYRAWTPIAMPAWVVEAIRRAPYALGTLRREGENVDAGLSRFNRQFIGWVILTVGSLIALAAACVALAAAI